MVSEAPVSAADRLLERRLVNGNVAGAAARGTVASMVGQWAGFVLQLGSTVVLARLLDPRAYGAVGMVIAITGIAELLKDFGLANATIQRPHVTHVEVTTLFWYNALTGLLASAIVAALAPLIAAFYSRPELTRVTLALSCTFLLSSLTAQFLAILNRHLRFGRLAAIDVGSKSVGFAVGITAAALGAGYWSLVYLQVTTYVVRLIAAAVASPWRPGRPTWRYSLVSDMVSFGGYLSLFNITNYASRNLDNVLIGRFYGAGPLGLYSRAYALLLLPLQQINAPLMRVAVPVLSHLQGDAQRFRRFYVTALRAVTYVSMPAIAGAAVAAPELVRVLLGPRWSATADIFRALAIAGLVQLATNTTGWLFVSTARTRRQAAWGLVSRPLICLAFVAGLPWGPRGVAWAYAIVTTVLAVPEFAVATRGTPVSRRDVGLALTRPFALAAVSTTAGIAVRAAASGRSDLVRGGLTMAAVIAVGAGAVALVPAVRRDVVELLTAVRRGGRRAEPAATPTVAEATTG